MEIDVAGKRPEWLDGDFQVRMPDYFNPENSSGVWGLMKHSEWSVIPAIRLPADHPYYLATSRGVTYWPGGEGAPEDWDGGDTIYRDGGRCDKVSWWHHNNAPTDIIGYKRRPDIFRKEVDEYLDNLPTFTTSPQPTGSAALSGSNGTYYDITIAGNKISCNDVIDALGLSFNHGELFKAAWRLGRKPGTDATYDLDKIMYFAKRMEAQNA